MTIPRDELRNLSFYRPIPCNPLQILNHKKLRKDDRSTKKKNKQKRLFPDKICSGTFFRNKLEGRNNNESNRWINYPVNDKKL